MDVETQSIARYVTLFSLVKVTVIRHLLNIRLFELHMHGYYFDKLMYLKYNFNYKNPGHLLFVQVDIQCLFLVPFLRQSTTVNGISVLVKDQVLNCKYICHVRQVLI
jgi:hypothetical protein